MSRVGFVLKPDKSEAGVVLDDLAPWLRAAGHVPVVTAEDQVAPSGAEVVPEAGFGASVDLAVVLGGDGTMLRAASLVADHGRPILGVNLGQLGFLTGFSVAEAKAALTAAIGGGLAVTERMRLAVTFRRNGSAQTRTALNDAVIHQSTLARLVEIDAHIDGELVAKYRADGLIVSTPTGSTAYNMAAGGPILVPGLAAMTLTPICPHSLTNRPLVIPPHSVVRLSVGAETRDVVLTLDGQWGQSIQRGDLIEVTAAAKPLRLFASRQSYFDIMRDKLHWGVRSDRSVH